MKKLSLVLLASLGVQYGYCATTNYDYQALVNQAYSKFSSDNSGNVANYIPELAKYNPKLFAITLITVDGKVYSAGDVKSAFPLESLSKVFTLAMALNQSGAQDYEDKIGSNATGLPFNSVTAVEQQPNHIGNGLVNAGAIATVSYINASNKEDKWDKIYGNLNNYAGTKLTFNKPVYDSEMATNQHNEGIAMLLQSYDSFYDKSPADDVDVYTRECSVDATTLDLAKMAIPFANHGKSPFTNKQLIDSKLVQYVLAEMTSAGMYDNSGNWLYETGVPAKSGVGGGMFAIVPGKYVIAAYSPRLDKNGNSIRSQEAIKYIVNATNGNMFNQ